MSEENTQTPTLNNIEQSKNVPEAKKAFQEQMEIIQQQRDMLEQHQKLLQKQQQLLSNHQYFCDSFFKDNGHQLLQEAFQDLKTMRQDVYVLSTSSLANFAIIGKDGEGSSISFKMRCTSPYISESSKLYTVKMIHDCFNQEQTDKGRRTEYHVLATIPLHPNILRVYTHFIDSLDKTKFGTGDDIKSMFVLYDYHPYTLAEWIAKQSENSSEKYLTEKQLRKFLFDILKGLDHLEKFKIVHRNLGLNNILISEDGRAVISGFEKALIFRSQSFTMFYHEKLDIGNKSNLPYEILSVKNPGEILDYRKVDIWQLGGLCFEMLGLQHPFKDWNKEKYNDNNLPTPNNISESMAKLIKSMIYFNPDSRPTPAEAIKILEKKENL